MNKILSTAIAISLLSSGVALAGNISTNTLKTATTSKKVQVQNKVQQKIKTIEKKIETVQDKFLKNFDVAMRNLNNLSAKASFIITKMSNSGKDVTATKVLFASSTLAISNARTEYNNLRNLVSGTASTTPKAKKALLASVKTQSEKTKTAIKTAHSSIVDVINSLKVSYDRDARANATTTTVISTSTASTTNQ